MNDQGLFYSEPVYRPPSEGKNSLLLTVTIGCSYNCSFCYPYRNKQFQIRKWSEIKVDILKAKKIYGNHVRRIFLLDGNAFIAKPELLMKVAQKCYEIHPNLERITAYAHAKDVLRKSDAELKAIRNAGITMVYMGIESGDDQILEEINKRTTAQEMIEAAQKLHTANIILSGTIILGIAGKNPKKSQQHAHATADLINQMAPVEERKWYISALTLMIPPTTPLEKAVRSGNFTPVNSDEALMELKWILEHISPSVKGCIFRSNHASNYLALKGILSRDKAKLIKQIDSALQNSTLLRPEWYRNL